MEYVLLESKATASLDKIEVTEGNSIYTKLKEYPYEFEINSSLQLASIDGVKVATVPSNDDDTIVSMTKSELKSLIASEVSSQLSNNSSSSTNNSDIGEIYSKSNKIKISNRVVWTDVTDATWTIPAGTWVIDFSFKDTSTGSGIWTFELDGLQVSDAIWKTGNDFGPTHFMWIKTYDEDTTGYFKYYQAISSTARDIEFDMYAVRIK